MRSLLWFFLICSVFQGSSVSAQLKAPTTTCVVSPDTPSDILAIRVEPQSGSRVVGSLSQSRKITRLDTLSRAGGDWIQVESGGVIGWAEGKLLICRAPVEQAREIIASQALGVVELFKQRNLRELSRLVHPVKGVRFSPYAFLGRKVNVLFTASTLPGALRDTRQRIWGDYDGSGAPIRLTFAEYYKRFIYDRDFAVASKISYNGGPIVKGNTYDNSFDEYPNAIIVEYHMPGIQPEQEGMD